MTTQLSAEDLRSLDYFWKDKGDISCWTGFDDAWPRIQSGFPELAQAWRAVEVTPRILTAVLHYMRQQGESDPSGALNQSELDDLWWAWREREDLTRVTWFTPSRLRALDRDYPELVKAWTDYLAAREEMDKSIEKARRLSDDLED